MNTNPALLAYQKELEIRVYRAVCDIYGVVCKQDAEKLLEVRRLTGQRYDAACQRWREYRED